MNTARMLGVSVVSQAASTLYLTCVLAEQERKNYARERFLLAEMRFLEQSVLYRNDRNGVAEPQEAEGANPFSFSFYETDTRLHGTANA